MLSSENRKNQGRPDLTHDVNVPPSTGHPTAPDTDAENSLLSDTDRVSQEPSEMEREDTAPGRPADRAATAAYRQAPYQERVQGADYVENQGVLENHAYLRDDTTAHDAATGTISETDYVSGPAPDDTRLHDHEGHHTDMATSADPAQMQAHTDGFTPEQIIEQHRERAGQPQICLLYTSPSPRD